MIDAALVSPAGEIRTEKGCDAGLGHIGTNEPLAERKDVGVIVLAGELRREGIVDPGAAAVRIAVHRNGDAYARTANGDSALCFVLGDEGRKLRSEFRIIDTFRTIGAKIRHFMTLLAQPLGEFVLQPIAGMIGGKGNAHGD